MRGYCLVVKHDKKIYAVELIPDTASNSPVDVIKSYCGKYGILPWPLNEWDEHPEALEWFVVRDGERLERIKWPDPRNGKEGQLISAIQIQVYRAFEILQVNYVKALEALENPTIDRALGLGWKPRSLGSALSLLANAMEENDQAETYREQIMDMIRDVPDAVEATESIFEYDADEFLENEGEPDLNAKAPADMTDEELIEQATQLYCAIHVTRCFGVNDVTRLQKLTSELYSRDYEIHSGGKYTIQKREEE